MNFSKSKVLLKKINAIHDSGSSFDNQLSTLERDLLLQYLRDLYECVLDEQHVVQKRDQPAPPQRIIEPPEQRVVEKVPENVPVAAENPILVAVEKHVTPSNGQVSEKKKTDPELESLFAQSEAVDLSQRFANTPISDISKAMGINERILTINDLFKGNQKVFDEVVERLNSLSSFEEAKDYLIQGIASKNDWAHKKNKQKAEVFVKLVRRRFL